MQLDSPTITNKYNLKIASFLLAIFFISSVHADVPTIIFPTVETEPVISPEDAADDPAIWINNADPKKSLIFGTDKKSGIYVYDLKGNQLSYSNLGKINNIDLRSVKGKLHIVTSNRTMSTLDYWIFDEQDLYKYFKSTPSNSFSESISHHHLVTGMSVYGVCMGLINNGLKAVITEEEGQTSPAMGS